MFQLRELWTVPVAAADDIFDTKSLVVVNDRSLQNSRIIVGGWSGKLKEFDGAGQSKGEFLLNGKILQLDTTEDFLIALTPHELITIDVNNLTAIVQRTTLKTPAFNFTLSEEGVNAIVQNTANSLASYDVTSGLLHWKVNLDNKAILPGAMISYQSNIYIVTLYQLECYRIDHLASNKTAIQWRASLGEFILDLKVGNSKSQRNVDLLVLGESRLFVLSTSGQLKYQMSLSNSPVSMHVYQKGDSYHVLIGSEAKRIELYSPEQRLIWAVRTSGGVPISIRLGALRGVKGVLTYLDSEGSLVFGYLGTLPNNLVVNDVRRAPVNFQQADTELQQLEESFNSHSINAEPENDRIEINDEVVCKNDRFYLDLGITNRFKRQIFGLSVSIEGAELPSNYHLGNLEPDGIVNAQMDLPFAFTIAANGRIAVTFSLANDQYHCFVKPLEIPLARIAEAMPEVQPQQSQIGYQLALKMNTPMEISEILPDLVKVSRKSTSLRFSDGDTISAVCSADSFTLHSDKFSKIWLVIQEIQKRNNFKFDGLLPIKEWAQLIHKYFEFRSEVTALDKELEILANQLRIIQKRLLSRYRENNPAPLQSLDILLSHTLMQIFALSQRRQSVNQTKKNLLLEIYSGWNIILWLKLRSQTGMSSVAFEEIRAFLGCIHSPSLGHGVEAVEWVECLDMMLCHLLKTSLAKSAKDQTVGLPGLQIQRDPTKFIKHATLVIERIDESTLASRANAEDLPYNIAIYVPCHFDFSQLEYVAPFFERFPGSKVFIYKWHGLREKIRDHYLSNEYKACKLGVFEFSLQTLISCILREEPGKKVVFLLTASMAYAFGSYQKQLLMTLKDLLPDRVWGVSVVGHCMYGCMSCKGVDHSIPVYFTRYFKQQLLYTAETVRKQYLCNPGAKPILVAPSTGETTMILHRDILDLLLRLQAEGKYEFVFKLHPACFNMGDYDMTYPPHIQEVENVKFILANFKVTSEQQPCLLPFYEAFDTILCDLHSSVGFMASYFAPRIIIAYHNDAHYEVPERDPKFLANINIFEEVNTLEKYLTKDTLVAKGSPEFFYQKYGKVDGNEIDRFAALAKWPRSAKFEHKRQQSSPDYRLYPAPSDWRKILRLAVDAWKAVLKRSIDAMKIPDPNRDEVLDNECKLALGISTDVTVEDESALLPRTQPLIVLSPEVDPLNALSVKVMSLNMWHGGEAHPAHHKLEVMAEMIVSMKADVVGLQEIAGVHPSGSNYPPTNEKADLRKCKIEEMANLIGSLASADGKPWYFINQGIVTPGKGNIQPWGIISRWPIHQTSPNKWGVLVNGPGNKRIWVFNVHLPYFPYQPYQLSGIPYEDAPLLLNEKDALDSSGNCRGSQMALLMDEIRQTINKDHSENLAAAYFVTGDFNEPSHQDWTMDAYVAGVHPIVCRWPSTNRLVSDLAFADSYRILYPDEIIKPGFTWAPRKPLETNTLDGLVVGEQVPSEHHDRIDFVFSRGQSLSVQVVDVKTIGARLEANHLPIDDGVVEEKFSNTVVDWPSDHRAVLATFIVQ